jgi:acyl-CoA dehydrogenase
MQLAPDGAALQMGAWCIGMSRRALDMMVEHTKQRVTFGQRLADRQAIQWWIADAAMKIHACRLMVYDAAAKADAGKDVRMEASMVKLYGTEMATEIIDHAMQTFGAMGVAKELPLQLMAQKVRTMRVYEGPSEVHRMAIARRIIGIAAGNSRGRPDFSWPRRDQAQNSAPEHNPGEVSCSGASAVQRRLRPPRLAA